MSDCGIRKQFALFLLHVAGRCTAEHRDLGVVYVVVGAHCLDLRDQAPWPGVLDLGLVEQVAVDLGFTRRR